MCVFMWSKILMKICILLCFTFLIIITGLPQKSLYNSFAFFCSNCFFFFNLWICLFRALCFCFLVLNSSILLCSLILYVLHMCLKWSFCQRYVIFTTIQNFAVIRMLVLVSAEFYIVYISYCFHLMFHYLKIKYV